MHYYSVAEILSEEEKTSLRFNLKCHGLGYLDDSLGNADGDLEEESRVQLPLWLAEPLSVKQFTTINQPTFYTNTFRNRVVTDATVINLRDRTPYFYEFCVCLASIKNDKELVQTLRVCFSSRYSMILDKALNAGATDASDFLNRLPDRERRFYEVGFASAMDLDNWKKFSLAKSKTVKATQGWSRKRSADKIF